MKITLSTAPTTTVFAPARPPGAVLGMADPYGAPSATGSTFWSRIMTCPREHALHTIAKLRPARQGEALSLGFIVHYGLEVYYRALMQSQRPWRKQCLSDLDVSGDFPVPSDLDRQHKQAAADTARTALRPLDVEPGYEEMMMQVAKMLDGFFDMALLDQFMVIAVEDELKFSRRGLTYTARIDTLIVDYGDRRGLWILEHKTARAINVSVVEGYQLNLQILGQAWLFKNTIDTRRAPVYRGVCIQILTKTTIPKYHRVHVTASPEHLQAFEQSLRAWSKLTKAYERVGWPADFTKCSGYARGYSKCAFYDLCQVRPGASIATLTEEDAPLGYRRAGADEPEPDTDR